jgi:hypothetical protein
MSVIRERQVTGGNGRGLRLKRVDIVWIWEGFGFLISPES